jgi:hypothetical protein
MVLFWEWCKLMTAAIHGMLASAIPTPATVILSGATITGVDSGGGPVYTSDAALFVRADGTIDKLETGSGTTQINSSTDWIIPNGSASGDYQVMIHEDSGTLNRLFQDKIDTWLSLAGDRDWGVFRSISAPGSKTCTVTLSIRKNGGPVIATAVYVLTAEAT